jgi:hypothetical protein
MKIAVPWILIASLAIPAIGRYLHPKPISNISRIKYEVKPLPGTGANTPSFPDSLPLLTSQDDDDSDDSDDILLDPASDEVWTKHIRKGNSLLCGLCGTDLDAGYQMGDPRTPPSAASTWAADVIERTD